MSLTLLIFAEILKGTLGFRTVYVENLTLNSVKDLENSRNATSQPEKKFIFLKMMGLLAFLKQTLVAYDCPPAVLSVVWLTKGSEASAQPFSVFTCAFIPNIVNLPFFFCINLF